MIKMNSPLFKAKFVHISPDARYRYGLTPRDERYSDKKLYRKQVSSFQLNFNLYVGCFYSPVL